MVDLRATRTWNGPPLEALANAETMLLEVRLRGLLPAGDRDELRRLGEILEARFLFGRVDTSGLRPAPDDDRWVLDLPAGILQVAAGRLRELADPASAGPRPEGATPEVAARALIELFALKGEVQL